MNSKKVGVELAKKPLKQVTSYAINAGCEWILLANAWELKMYHVEFGQPPKVEILDAWNLMEDEIAELAEKFEVISYRSVKRNGLDKIWRRVKVLAPKSLLAATCTEDVLRFIRRNLRKNTGILVNNTEAEPMTGMTEEIQINVPVERLSKFVADYANTPRYTEPLVSFKPTTKIK